MLYTKRTYREEFEQYERDGIVTLHTAFSRVEGTAKTYVQHLMEQHSSDLINILERGGRIYVCGDGNKMAPAVESALLQAYRTIHGVGHQEAKDWLDSLQTEERYAKDVWA